MELLLYYFMRVSIDFMNRACVLMVQYVVLVLLFVHSIAIFITKIVYVFLSLYLSYYSILCAISSK